MFTGLGTAALVALVMLQPDLGSAFILLAIWLFLILVVGLPKKQLLVMVSVFLLTAAAFWLFWLKDYQKQRIISFVSPMENTRDAANLARDYNVNQSIIAVGSGGVWGKGLGYGSQSQLRFLPEANTDFIFAVVTEELGLVGATLTLFCFGLLFYRLLKTLRLINNDFGVFFILGASGLIFIEMLVNIGMNLGLLPVVGIGLPFLSYGGSAIITHLALIGIVQSIVIRSKLKNY